MPLLLMDCPCHCFPQHTIRALALRVLKEILRNQPARFKNYAELTIMKTLEAHKDSHKEVHSSHISHMKCLDKPNFQVLSNFLF